MADEKTNKTPETPKRKIPHKWFITIMGTLITLVLGTWLTYYSQLQMKKYEYKQQELSKATETFEQLSNLMDLRRYRLSELRYGLKNNLPKEDLQNLEENYNHVKLEWYQFRNRNPALIQRYFSEDLRIYFLANIHKQFRNVEKELKSILPYPYYEKRDNNIAVDGEKLNNCRQDLGIVKNNTLIELRELVNGGPDNESNDEFSLIDCQLSLLNYKIYILDNKLIKCIQDENFSKHTAQSNGSRGLFKNISGLFRAESIHLKCSEENTHDIVSIV